MVTPLEPLIYWTGIAAVSVNAASGVLEAGRKPVDLFGAIFVAFAAALGGGTLRDLLLDRGVFWVVDQTYLVAAVVTAILTFTLARLAALPTRLFLLPDAVGLALFTVSGTQIALAQGVPWLAASLMGVITGVVGGVARDVLCNEVPLVFGGTLYATASWAGALLLVAMTAIGVESVVAAWLAMATILAVRLAAMVWGIGLPRFIGRE